MGVAEREGVEVVEGVREAEVVVEGVREAEVVVEGVPEAEVVVEGVRDGLAETVLEHEGAAPRPGTVQAEGQGQGRQVEALVAPRVVLYVPAAHRVQTEAPAAEKAPAGHWVCVGEQDPAGQE